MKTVHSLLVCLFTATSVSAIPGDLNGDGKITLDDCKLLAVQVASGTASDAAAVADIDGDGKVTIVDAMRLHQSIGGLWIDPTGKIAPVPQVTQEERSYLAKYEDLCSRYETMSPETFLNGFQPAPAYVKGLDPSGCLYYQKIDSLFHLTADQKTVLQENGMVVLNRSPNDGIGFGYVYRDVFVNDLPVFFTSDALLDPLYKMYDNALKTVEEYRLVPLMTDALSSTVQELAAQKKAAAGNSSLEKVYADAQTYCAVAAALLDGKTTVTGDAEADRYLASIGNEALAEQYDFFGITIPSVDFSQFKPRGHYECLKGGDCTLSRYFKCMMWLGRADCALNVDSLDQLRMFAAIHAAMDKTGVLDDVAQVNQVVSFFVGDVDAFSLEGLSDVMTKKQVNTDSVLVSDNAAQQLLAGIRTSGGGNQLILSQAIWKDPDASRPELPVIAQICGQRFILDSYLLGRTVEGYVKNRNKPLLEEVPFCLGNNAATAVIAPDAAAYTVSNGDYRPYHARLGAARALFENYPYWDRNLYTLWLDGLRSLSVPLSDAVPLVMRSRTWQEKQMNTQLASWAQLRHNTLLYAKQSYTMGVSCFYPDGYVEPYPRFYRTIGEIVRRLKSLTDNIVGTNSAIGLNAASWTMVCDSLASMAELELQGLPLTPEHIAFLNTMFVKNPDGICGAPPYIGWYTQLFKSEEELYSSRPCIADVHTIPPSIVKPDDMVLHAATGDASIAIIQAATQKDCATLYVGAVSSFYQHDEEPIKRLADSDWKTLLEAETQPKAPAWFEKYKR